MFIIGSLAFILTTSKKEKEIYIYQGHQGLYAAKSKIIFWSYSYTLCSWTSYPLNFPSILLSVASTNFSFSPLSFIREVAMSQILGLFPWWSHLNNPMALNCIYALMVPFFFFFSYLQLMSCSQILESYIFYSTSPLDWEIYKNICFDAIDISKNVPNWNSYLFPQMIRFDSNSNFLVV